jgi:hypothetical protein
LAILRINKDTVVAPDRDRFIMSKHCSGAFYSTLAAGILDPSELNTYMRPVSRLNGHPDCNKVPGVEANTGPLGHGLPIGVGCALAAKMDEANWRTFVLVGALRRLQSRLILVHSSMSPQPCRIPRGWLKWTAEISLPAGVSGQLMWKGKASPLHEGEEQLALP